MRRQESLPPAAALLGVALLVTLVLPNPLRIPQNNPAAQAEYAPVPGEQDDASDANFGETGQATSGGIGSGGLGEGGPLDPPPEGPDDEDPFKQLFRQKRCYGEPPRQLPDPLAPPCVSYFDGDNGGSTWQGVTRDEILIVYYNDFGVKGDLTKPYQPNDDKAGYPPYYHTNHVRTIKAQLRYFVNHFQTFKRRVRMVGHASPQGLGTKDSARIADFQIMSQMKPFAIVTLIENAQVMGRLAKEYGIPVFGWNEDVPLEVFEDNAPYMWSFMPDQATETVWSAEFICRKLYGRPARFTDDPLLLGKPRKFGLLFQSESNSNNRGPFLSQLARQLSREVSARCGPIHLIRSFDGDGTGASTYMAQFKREEITTVICYCIAQQTELHVPKFQGAASGLSYYPEWYWDSTAAMDRTLWQREYGNPRHKGFGSSYLWRQGVFEDSWAYKAFLEQEPGQVPNLRFNFEMYHTLLSLFSGLQGAGPNLTPESIERGMFTFKWPALLPSGKQPIGQSPFVPTGGYGLGGPSRYTFVHTAMGWWYDPSGTPPGKNDPSGCIRVIHKGRRFLGPDWPLGDDDLFDPDDPCTEDTRREV